VEALLERSLAAWKGSPDGVLSTAGVSWCLEGLADLKLKLGKVRARCRLLCASGVGRPAGRAPCRRKARAHQRMCTQGQAHV